MNYRSSNSGRSNHAYLSNFAVVEIPDVEIEVGYTTISGPDHIKNLRQQYGQQYVFVRRDNEVVDIPILEGISPLGRPSKIKLKDDLGIASNLTKEALIRHLVNKGRKLNQIEPVSFMSESSNDNLLSQSWMPGSPCPNWLAIQAQPEISVRCVRFANQSQIVVMIFNVWTTNVIGTSCDVLFKLGVDLIGKYVAVPRPGTDSRFRSKGEVLGKVLKIESDIIHLDDPKYPDITTVTLAEAFLEPRIENVELCINAICGKSASAVINSLHQKMTELRGGPGRFSKIQSHANYFGKKDLLEIVPSVFVSVGPIVKEGKSKLFPKVESLPRPTYVFDPTRQRTHLYHDKGLDVHGPYDQVTFSAPNPRVAIICQASKKGQVEQFLRKFWDGMPTVTTKKGSAPFEKGFLRKYCTNPWEVEFFLTTGNSADAYNKAVQQALEKVGVTGRRWNLAMIQIEEHFRELPPPLNPYLTTKASFLSHGIASQDFTIETISKVGTQLAYSLNQMALATYAKLGGIPWLLAATPSVSHELIFGLGSANVGGGRFSSKERFVGITTVFKGDGDYILENRSKAVGFSDYPEQVLSTLRSTIDLLKQRYNWQKGESIRLIFHAFKPLKDVEVDAVKLLMEEIATDFSVEYAFVHVVDSHPFLLFNENQSGVMDFESKKTKGVWAPTRGHYVQLNKHEGLLSLIGASEVKKASDGLPSPILLRLHKGSTFVDMTYLARQAFVLSSHSWRTFMPSGMPITVTYSDLIARLLGDLSLIPRWNPDTMLGPIGSSRWFL